MHQISKQPAFKLGQIVAAQSAILIEGEDAGSIFYLCQTEKCDVHNRVTRY